MDVLAGMPSDTTAAFEAAASPRRGEHNCSVTCLRAPLSESNHALPRRVDAICNLPGCIGFHHVGEILSLPKQPVSASVPESVLDSTPSVPPPSVRFLAWGFEKNPNIRDTAVDFTTSGY
jgi:hypothetical protein